MQLRHWSTAVLMSLVLVAAPVSVSAHAMNTGFGPFYDGLAHLFATPEDLLMVIAVTLLAGMRGPRVGRTLVFALPAAWLIGAMAGLIMATHHEMPGVTAVLLIALGALVAADRKLSLAALSSLAVLLGLMQGYLNGAVLAPLGALAFGGAVCSVFVVAALVAGQAASLRVEWARVAARVAGSWIAAIGLLMLGWAVRTTFG